MKYYNITVNGVAYSVSVEETAAGAAPVAAAPVAAPAAPKAPAAPAAAPKAAAAAGAVSVKAPMPGNILDVKVSSGASDLLVVRFGPGAGDSRSAVGVVWLRLGVWWEICLIVWIGRGA